MPETINRTDSPATSGLTTPWQIMLHDVELSAVPITEEIMTDSVLGESITMSVSAYLAQRDKLDAIRKEFAEADTICGQLRNEAAALMRSHGIEFEWDNEDVGAVEPQMVVKMIYAAERAGTINKRRIEADQLSQQLLDRAVDEIALCANIAVLRQMEQFSCPGEAFCIAFVATAILREKMTGDVPLSVATRTLSEWLQYSIGVKARNTELDIYAHSHIAQGIGKGMGIDNSGALRLALLEAMKKLNAKKSD